MGDVCVGKCVGMWGCYNTDVETNSFFSLSPWYHMFFFSSAHLISSSAALFGQSRPCC